MPEFGMFPGAWSIETVAIWESANGRRSSLISRLPGSVVGTSQSLIIQFRASGFYIGDA